MTAHFDGPFDPKTKPWLLSNQHKLGIEVQRDLGGGMLTQPHGYLYGAKGKVAKSGEAEDEGGSISFMTGGKKRYRNDTKHAKHG